ncbi:unnamed protein product [Prunus armeniaca]
MNFGSSRPLSRSCFSGKLPFPAISSLSFFPFSMARSDGGRNWGMYAGSKSASLPGSLHQGAEALASSLF